MEANEQLNTAGAGSKAPGLSCARGAVGGEAFGWREMERELRAFCKSRCGEGSFWSCQFTAFEAANQVQAGKRGLSLAAVYDLLFELVNRRTLVEVAQSRKVASRTFHFVAPADRSAWSAAAALARQRAIARKRGENGTLERAAASLGIHTRGEGRTGEGNRQQAPGNSRPARSPCSRTDTTTLSEANQRRGVSLAADESGKAATPVGAERESDRRAT